jgi:hypothetical protein
MRENLVAGSSSLSDHTLELINLRLGTSESTELLQLSEAHRSRDKTENIPSSSRAYGHAYPCYYGGVR